MLKHIITAILSVLVPILWTVIVAQWPDFPMDTEQLLALFLWIVGLFLSGSSTTRAYQMFSTRYR